MRLLAKILLAGTAAATVASAAEAQTPRKGEVVNEQVLLDDALAGGRLRVIDPADGVKSEQIVAGNVDTVGAVRDTDYDSDQTVKAKVRARTKVEVHGWTPDTKAFSAASGNVGEAWAIDGAVIDSRVRQVVDDGASVKAKTDVRADLSSSGDTDARSQALGNSQSYAVGTGAYSASDTLQRQHGTVKARTDASLFHVKGTATLEAIAGSNDISHTGNAASGSVDAHQHATGQTVATVVGDVRSGYLVDGAANASGNSISLQSLSREAALDARQKQEGYVRAETYLTVRDFGGISASAYGVGNSIIAENDGELDIYADQENDARVDVDAAFFGGNGYDADVSAAAYGNSVYGAACGDCNDGLYADNRQVNTAGVNASARPVINGSARSVSSTARAVGNSAVFYGNGSAD
jgi:hypothetical protein